MRRLLGWIGGVVGGVAVYRFWRRHRAAEAAPEPDDRADELRAKLAESREAEPAVEEPPAEPAEQDSPEERRRRVHEEGRAALDGMQSE